MYMKENHNAAGQIRLKASTINRMLSHKFLIAISTAFMISLGIVVWQAHLVSNLKTQDHKLSSQLASDNREASTTSTDTQSSQTGNSPEVSMDEIVSTLIGNFTINYPAGWSTQVVPISQGSQGPSIASIVSTAPSGKTNLKIDLNYGGRGGDCTPEKSDKPHAAGNACDTYEYLSKEALGKTVFDELGHKLPIYLVKVRYTDPEGNSQYLIGLTAGSITVGQPQMGRDYPIISLHVYDEKGANRYHIDFVAKGNSQSFFDAPEALAIIESLKSFSFR